jgi:hypothetical protein
MQASSAVLALGIGLGGVTATQFAEPNLARLPIMTREFRASRDMATVLRTAQMVYIGEDQPQSIGDSGIFIRQMVTTKNGNPEVDPWGVPYRVFIRGNRLYISSAGADRLVSSGDDLVQSIEFY